MSINEILMSLEIGLIYGIIAIGIYLTFRIIDFPDLTCDGSFVLGAAISSLFIKVGYNPFIALLIAIAAGSIAGLATGVLNTRFKISDLLSGILVSFMLYSINLRVMGGVPNIALINDNTVFTNYNPLVVLAVISVIILIIFSYILNTNFGLALRSIGQNKRLAVNSGVNVKLITIFGLMFSNGLIALGGGLFSQHQGFTDVGSGVGTVIVGLASVIIGERILPYRSILVQIFSCLAGSILYRLFISFALYSEILGLETQDLNLITGLMVICVMILPRSRLC